MKYIISILFALFFKVFALADSLPEDWLKAIAFYQQKDYPAALKAIQSVEKHKIDKAEYHMLLGNTYYQMDNFSEALEHYMDAERIDRGIAAFQIAKIYAKQGSEKESVDYLKENLNSRFKEDRSTIILDSDFQQISKSQAWKELWQKEWYTDLEMQLQETRYYLGSENFFQALDIVDNLLEKYPDNHEMHYLRGLIYQKIDNPSNAIKEFSRAISINKRRPDYFLHRAQAYMDVGKISNAMNDYEKVLKIDPSAFSVYLKRANAYLIEGESEKALKDIQSYLHFFPEDEETMFHSARVYQQLNRDPDAVDIFSTLIRQNGENDDYYLYRGDSFQKLGRYQDAFYDYSMALDLDPRNPITYLKRGDVRLRKGDKKGACIDWEKAKNLGSREASGNILQFCK